jgi:hypothetical protein
MARWEVDPLHFVVSVPRQESIAPSSRSCPQYRHANRFLVGKIVVVKNEAKKAVAPTREFKLITGPTLDTFALNP